MVPVTLKAIEKLLDQKLDQKLTEQDKRFDKKLKPIKKDLKDIKKKLNSTVSYFERVTNHHKKCIDRLDDEAGLEHLPQPTP